MGKLLNLRRWLTTGEAAKQLSTLFGEEVNEADVLRLALDGHLCLSVNFVNHAEARRQKIIPVAEAKTVPSLDGTRVVILGDYWDNDHVMVSDGQILTVSGIFDLTMVGGERLDVEHAFQQLTGGPEVTLTCIDGCLVRAEDGTYWKLQDSFEPRVEPKPDGSKHKVPRSYYPAGGLPHDSVLVVRTASLMSLARSPEEKADQSLSARERTTYENIIGALLELVKSPRPGRESDAAVIRELVENYGEKPGISKSNLERKFPEAKRSLSQS